MFSFLTKDPERMRLKGDLDGLIRLIRSSPDTSIRIEAALALGRMQTPRAIPELLRVLGDPDPRVVDASSQALEYIGRPAIRPLVEAFNSSDETIARWIHHTLERIGVAGAEDILGCTPGLNEAGEERVAYTLLSFGKPVLPHLIRALGNQDRRIARFAEAVLETDGREALPVLIEALDDPDEEIRSRVASLLIIFGEQIVPDLLASCAQDRDETRDLKFYIINEIGQPALEPLYDALKDSNPVTSSMALKVFMDLGDASIEPLIRGLYDENPGTRALSENALIRIGEPVVPYLIREIPMHREDDREVIESVLIRIGEPAVPELTRALFDPSAETNRTVSAIIPRLGSLAAPRLLDVIEEKGNIATGPVSSVFREMGRISFPFLEEAITTRSRKVALFAVTLLREIDPIRSIDPLVDALSNHDEQVRETAMNELVQLGDMTTPRFIQALSSGNAGAAKLAETALRQMGSPAVPHLADALGDPLSSDPARISAILRDIGDEALPFLIPMIQPGNPGREMALELVRGTGMDAVPHLLAALGSAGPGLAGPIREELTRCFEQNPGLFIGAVRNLPEGVGLEMISGIIRSEPEQVIPHLTRMISDGEREEAQFAGELLTTFGDSAIDPLISCLQKETDEDNKLVLTQYLVRMGPAAVPSLIRAFQDPSLGIYTVAALGSIGKPAVPALVEALGDPDPEIANYAGLSLARIGEPALDDLFTLFQKDKRQVPMVSGILAEMGGPALPRLLEEFKGLKDAGEQGSERGISLMSIILQISLTDTSQMHELYSLHDDEMLRMLTGILVSKGDVVIDPMIGALLTWDGPTPPLLLQTFSSMKGPVITRIHDVMTRLADRDQRRIPLIHLLGELRDPGSKPVIYSALSDSDRKIRVAAVRELGKFGEEAMDHLKTAYEDTDDGVRVAAIESMGDIGLPALDQLLNAIKDENGDIRAAAINGIGKIGEPGKFMLIQALTDPDRQVRRDVVRLLDGFGWEPKYTTDRLSYLYAKEAWDQLIEIGPPATDILIRGAKDPDAEIRDACVRALKEIRNSPGSMPA